MPRPITLFTGQWADLPLDTLAAKAKTFGYDGLELACWGDHFEVSKATAMGDAGKAYCQGRHDLLAKHGLKTWAISSHLVGQAVCDAIDHRHKAILPAHVWGDGDAELARAGAWSAGEGVRQRAAEEMKATARAAAMLGVKVVNGFTGSRIWPMLYFFPPTSQADVKAGFDDFAKRWGPILDVFKSVGVKFALEVHPTEIAYDIHTAQRALDTLKSSVGSHESFGFNFDPSHLLWQGIDPARFIDRFGDRIVHCHMKDAHVCFGGGGTSNGAVGGGGGVAEGSEHGILGSHLDLGDHRRAWNFRSVGRGSVNFEAIIRALNRAGYSGPLSVEWEDQGMDREQGARESCAYLRRLDFAPSSVVFDKAFERKA
jgi:sugar phosphate isomerase/epimerase